MASTLSKADTQYEERPDGGSARSQATDAATGRWHTSPWWPRIIKFVMFALPIVFAMVAGSLYARVLGDPSSWFVAALWWLGLMSVTSAVVYISRPLIQRLSPLAFLYQLTLVFPDTAPDRFKMAIRQRSVRDLQRRLTNGQPLGDTPQEAAENVVLLVNALNEHDRRTRGHCERVRAYSDLIAEDMKLSPDDRTKLHWAALLHDVGKLAVPPEILNKDGRPTDEEWQLLRQHPGASGRLLVPLIPWLGEWLLASTQHHERWDGDGYPRGLKGNEISLAGRIVAVADAYDVMTSTRSYKAAWSRENARLELARNAGTQFDPRVVRAFMSIPSSHLHRIAGPLSWFAEFPRIAEVIGRLGTVSGTTVGGVASAVTTAALATLGLTSLGFNDAPDATAMSAVVAAESNMPDGAPAADDPVVVDEGSETTTTLAMTDLVLPESGVANTTAVAPAEPESTTTTVVTSASTIVDTSIATTTVAAPPTTTRQTTTTTLPPPPSTTTSTTTTTTTGNVPTTTVAPPPPGGYALSTRDQLNGGGPSAPNFVYLIAESVPTLLDDPLVVLAPVADITAGSLATATIPAGSTVCSSIVHARTPSGASAISFEINFIGTILGFSVTNAQLAQTSWFFGAGAPSFLGIEGSDTVGFDGSKVRGTLYASATDADQVRVYVSC
ncbi:MAG: HD-GYP domain-containing protein [Acidimicrobiales bacterium]|nr:HD-GYP domain-containing protein [Acidimicrobiales bacterium]